MVADRATAALLAHGLPEGTVRGHRFRKQSKGIEFKEWRVIWSQDFPVTPIHPYPTKWASYLAPAVGRTDRRTFTFAARGADAIVLADLRALAVLAHRAHLTMLTAVLPRFLADLEEDV